MGLVMDKKWWLFPIAALVFIFNEVVKEFTSGYFSELFDINFGGLDLKAGLVLLLLMLLFRKNK